MLLTSGRSSPSFLAAVVVACVAVAGLTAWWFLRPSPHAASEQLVRDFAQTVGQEVGAFRRELRGVRPPVKDDAGTLAEALTSIDALTAKAIARIEAHTEAVHDKLAALNISVGTQRNRLKRLEARAREAKDMITRAAEDTKARLRDKK